MRWAGHIVRRRVNRVMFSIGAGESETKRQTRKNEELMSYREKKEK
jgi:hypothetical protein